MCFNILVSFYLDGVIHSSLMQRRRCQDKEKQIESADR